MNAESCPALSDTLNVWQTCKLSAKQLKQPLKKMEIAKEWIIGSACHVLFFSCFVTRLCMFCYFDLIDGQMGKHSADSVSETVENYYF